MGYLEEMRKKNEQKALQALQTNQVKRDEYLATLANPDSNVDEYSKLIRFFLLPMFSLWVWYLGYIYTTNSLAGVVEPWQAWILALVLPSGIQIIKIYAATKTLRAFHFKWYDRSAQELSFWSLSALLVVLMFGWSLKISIFDVKDAASDNFIASNTESLDARISSATSAIDGQIAAINTGNADASTMKTKRGKIAWSGQSILMQNSTTLSTLAAQRKAIVDQTTLDFKEGKAKTAEKAVSRGSFFQRFGGFGEVGEIIFCLLLGLAEAINRNNNLKRLENGESAQPSPTPQEPLKNAFSANGKSILNSAQPSPTPQEPLKNAFSANGKSILNSASQPLPGDTNTTLMQFRWDGYGQTSAPPQNGVSHQAQGVTHQPSDVSHQTCDDIMRLARKDFGSWAANIGNQKHDPANCSRHIHQTLDSLRHNMTQTWFAPSRRVAIETYDYFARKLEELDAQGWPYDHKDQIIRELRLAIPQEKEIPA